MFAQTPMQFKSFWSRIKLVLTTIILLTGYSTPTFAVDEFGDLRIIDKLPMTKAEVGMAHQRSRVDSCEIILDGQPLEQSSFSPYLTDRDKRVAQSTKQIPIPAARHSLLSVGLEIDSEDQKDLPTLSGRQILNYLDDNYVIIQARVRRDLLDKKLYYSHRPIAVTALYRGSKLTQKFEAVIANSVRDFHALGLFRSSQSSITKPEQLRTMVLLFRNSVQVSKYRTEDRFEYAFIVGRESENPERLDSHVFITDNERTELVYLKSFEAPFSVRDTTVRGSVKITGYDSSGIFPKESITKSYSVNSQRKFSISTLDKYALEQKLNGGWSSNVDTVLAAIIDKKIQ